VRFASLGSGSRGNAWVIEVGQTRILLDCGFGPRNLASRLSRIGLTPQDLTAIVLTHEHADHAAGIVACVRNYGTAAFLTHGTFKALALDGIALAPMFFDPHAPFVIGAIQVTPFPVPHDAREPAQFVFSDGACRLGVLTDTGCITPHMIDTLSGCEALVLECNHDTALLAGGNYPPQLKQRIAGRYGHLDNATAANLLTRMDCSRLRHIVAAHLSQENNRSDLATAVLAAALSCTPDWIGVADQESGCAWRQIA
jgi:phosphoribosyl 1,2-cyclic phosphodiesterase